MRMTADDLLIEARGVLPHRPGPAQALAAQAAGALLGRLDGAAVDAVLEAPATACHAAPAVPRVAWREAEPSFRSIAITGFRP